MSSRINSICLRIAVTFVLGFSLLSTCAAADAVKHAAYLDAESGGLAFQLQGEYTGIIGDQTILGAQVIAGRDDSFNAVLFAKGLPGGGWFKTKVPLKGKLAGNSVPLEGRNFQATLQQGVLRGTGEGASFELHKIHRQSPTLGMQPPEGAIVLFDGSNANEWVNGKFEEGGLLGVGCRTKRHFGSCVLHIEFRTPFMPTALGQGRGNSGVYLADQYECQILDSFGLSGENNECGGFYKLLKPRINMCLPPLTWQTYDFEFQAAKFDANKKKTHNAVVTLRHNGVLIHDHAELLSNTPGGGLNDESQPGSIFLQDHGNPVRFRNIWIIDQK